MKAAQLYAILPALLLSALPGRAQELVFHLQPAESRVEFTLPATLHTVHGTFQFKSGAVQFNPATGEAGGALVLDARSGNTGNSSRDRRMHQQILQDQKYPDIVFTAQHVSGNLAPQGTSQIQLQGRLTLHGQEHPITFTLPVQIAHDRLSADVRFVVPYLQWGLKNPSTFLLRVGKNVNVEVHAVGYLTRSSGNPTPASPCRLN